MHLVFLTSELPFPNQNLEHSSQLFFSLFYSSFFLSLLIFFNLPLDIFGLYLLHCLSVSLSSLSFFHTQSLSLTPTISPSCTQTHKHPISLSYYHTSVLSHKKGRALLSNKREKSTPPPLLGSHQPYPLGPPYI